MPPSTRGTTADWRSGLRMRIANERDRATIQSFWAKEAVEKPTADHVTSRGEDYLMGEGQRQCLIAFVDGEEVVGYFAVTTRTVFDDDDRAIRVLQSGMGTALYIEYFQSFKKGCGKRMLRHMWRACMAGACHSVELVPLESAKSFWAKYGWKPMPDTAQVSKRSGKWIPHWDRLLPLNRPLQPEHVCQPPLRLYVSNDTTSREIMAYYHRVARERHGRVADPAVIAACKNAFVFEDGRSDAVGFLLYQGYVNVTHARKPKKGDVHTIHIASIDVVVPNKAPFKILHASAYFPRHGVEALMRELFDGMIRDGRKVAWPRAFLSVASQPLLVAPDELVDPASPTEPVSPPVAMDEEGAPSAPPPPPVVVLPPAAVVVSAPAAMDEEDDDAPAARGPPGPLRHPHHNPNRH